MIPLLFLLVVERFFDCTRQAKHIVYPVSIEQQRKSFVNLHAEGQKRFFVMALTFAFVFDRVMRTPWPLAP